MNKRLFLAAVIVGIWALLGTVLTAELFLTSRVRQEYVDMGEIMISQFGRAAMWAALVPLILELRERVPLATGRWWGGVGFHLAAAFTVMMTYYLGRIFFYTVFWHEPMQEFWHNAVTKFWGRNLVDLVFYWGVIGLGYEREIQQRYRDQELCAARLGSRLMEAELKALRQQLHPHFLFNTLNTVSVLVREQRNDEAVTLLARLGTLLRMALDNTGVPETSLRQELDFLGRYLEIQQMRFADRLTVRIDVAPAALDARIPNLLLQPLVENAIIHGIAPKIGAGIVEVLGRVEGRQLHLEVRDDGPGLDDGQRLRPGVGLANTRERLERLYGSQARLVLHSEPGRGVSVQISLPFQS